MKFRYTFFLAIVWFPNGAMHLNWCRPRMYGNLSRYAYRYFTCTSILSCSEVPAYCCSWALCQCQGCSITHGDLRLGYQAAASLAIKYTNLYTYNLFRSLPSLPPKNGMLRSTRILWNWSARSLTMPSYWWEVRTTLFYHNSCYFPGYSAFQTFLFVR